MDNRPQVVDEADTPWTVALLAMVLAGVLLAVLRFFKSPC
jgi:hypothetical protein